MAHQTPLVLVQTRVPKQLAAKLKKEAKDSGMLSQAALVRRILTDYFAVKEAIAEKK